MILTVSSIVFFSPAIAEIHFTQNRLGETIELSGLYNDPSCSLAKFSGRVVSRTFADDAISLSGFVVEYRDGTRSYINVGGVPETADMATRWATFDGLQRMTKPGRAVHGHVLQCGAAGGVLNLQEISN